MPGNVSFLEIGSKDAAVSRTFFEGVFGWTYNSMGDAGGWFQTPSIKAGLHALIRSRSSMSSSTSPT